MPLALFPRSWRSLTSRPSPTSRTACQPRTACGVPGLVLAGLLGALLPSAHAEDDLERERLARIAHELERVQALVAEAGRQPAPAQRVQFRYDWLQRDLEMVRAGIVQHVDAPRQPRPAPPLRGDYRQ
jgi:RAQPRD family integrative conjugative element protein